MSTLRATVENLLIEAHVALASGRGPVAIIGDRATTRHLPKLLTEALEGEIDAVTVPLAGSRETVTDCLSTAIREARISREEGTTQASSNQQGLALLLPDALSVPMSSLRSLHDIASGLGSHRLVLFVDGESSPFPDPVEELKSRIGVPVRKVQLEKPKLQLQAQPTPAAAKPAVAKPAPEPLRPAAPKAPKRAEAPTPSALPEPDTDALPRFAKPIVVAQPQRVDIRSLRRSRRRARAWRWSVLTAAVAACLAAPEVVRHGPALVALAGGDAAELAAPEPPTELRVPVADTEPAPVVEAPAKDPAPPVVQPAAPRPRPAARPASSPAPKQTASARSKTPAKSPAPAKRAPSRRSAAAPRSSASAAVPTTALVLVNFNAEPWAELEVDYRKLGPTPIGNVRLSVGHHRVRATFPDGRVVVRRIRVDEGQRRFQIR